MKKTIARELEESGLIVQTTVGQSMEPLLYERKTLVEIRKVDDDLKGRDMVLFLRENGEYVLHRILKVRQNDYWICGDNQTVAETVPKSRVIGVVRRYYRKNRWHAVSDFGYRCYVWVWSMLFPVRKYLLAVRNLWKFCIGRR